jgi:hypothetical protein
MPSQASCEPLFTHPVVNAIVRSAPTSEQKLILRRSMLRGFQEALDTVTADPQQLANYDEFSALHLVDHLHLAAWDGVWEACSAKVRAAIRERAVAASPAARVVSASEQLLQELHDRHSPVTASELTDWLTTYHADRGADATTYNRTLHMLAGVLSRPWTSFDTYLAALVHLPQLQPHIITQAMPWPFRNDLRQHAHLLTFAGFVAAYADCPDTAFIDEQLLRFAATGEQQYCDVWDIRNLLRGDPDVVTVFLTACFGDRAATLVANGFPVPPALEQRLRTVIADCYATDSPTSGEVSLQNRDKDMFAATLAAHLHLRPNPASEFFGWHVASYAPAVAQRLAAEQFTFEEMEVFKLAFDAGETFGSCIRLARALSAQTLSSS